MNILCANFLDKSAYLVRKISLGKIIEGARAPCAPRFLRPFFERNNNRNIHDTCINSKYKCTSFYNFPKTKNFSQILQYICRNWLEQWEIKRERKSFDSVLCQTVKNARRSEKGGGRRRQGAGGEAYPPPPLYGPLSHSPQKLCNQWHRHVTITWHWHECWL